MLELHGPMFVRTMASLTYLVATIEAAKKANATISMSDDTYAHLKSSLESVSHELKQLGLVMSSKTATRLLGAIDGRKEQEYGNLCNEFIGRVADEIESLVILTVPGHKQKYYESENAFLGEDVLAKFPSAVREAEEARKCYALGRNTATVFHLMRILELGLNSLAHQLSVPFDKRNWENIINDIEAKVKNIGPSFGADWKASEKFYSEAAVQFRYFKNAWRNHVMHIRDSHDEESAVEILDHVKAFMRHLSTKLSE